MDTKGSDNNSQESCFSSIGEVETPIHQQQMVSFRYIHTQVDLESRYQKPPLPVPTLRSRVKRLFKCPTKSALQYFESILPIVCVIKSYKIGYLLNDFVAGITIGCLSFPLGIAFGVLASLSPAHGLYTSFTNVLVYMLFGTSRHVSFGTNGIISMFVSELIHKNLHQAAAPNATNPEDDIELKSSIASGATCIIGLILFLMGIFRLGFIVNYLSSSFVNGFTTAGGIYIVTSMLPDALGIKITRHSGPGNLFFTYKEIFEAVPRINVGSLIASLLTAFVILFFKDYVNVKFRDKMKSPIPIDFVVIIIATIVSHFTNLSESFEMEVIGNIPAGIPPPKVPYLAFHLVPDSFLVAIMIFTLSVSMSRLCEAAHNYRVDDNQELVAYGLSNFVSSFFLCFPSCAGPARTITLCLMGPKSTLHATVSTSFILIILLWIGPMFQMLPKSVLATMVVIAVKKLVTQMKELPEMWRLNRYDFFTALGTILAGCCIDFPYSLYIGVILCMFSVVVQSQNPKAYLLGKQFHEDRFISSDLYSKVIIHPRIKIFKFESSLYFATAEQFRRKLRKLTLDRCNASAISERQGSYIVDDVSENNVNTEHISLECVESFTRLPWGGLHDKTLHNKDYVIVDCGSINYIDINGLRILIEVICELENVGITLVFANCNQYVRNFFKKSELSKKISEEHIFAEVWDAYQSLQL